MSPKPQRLPDAVVRRSGHASDLFVVSNLGQVRNAAAVVQQMGLPSPLLLLLWTDVNPGVMVAMSQLAEQLELPARAVRLPRAPTSPMPWRIREMTRLVDQLPLRFPTDRLWLCNANSYYAYLAERFATSGASISLFEEGLGTYRSRYDPPFVRLDIRARLRQLRGEVQTTMWRRGVRPRRRVIRIGYRIARFLVETRPGQAANDMMTSGWARRFREPWTSFAQAAVAFPGVLDPHLVRAASTLELRIQPGGLTHDSVTEVVDAAAPDVQLRPLLLSQRYGIPITLWGWAIAAEVRALGVDEVLLKHHPREREPERAALVAALEEAGLSIATNEGLEYVPAEYLIAQGLSAHVIGLTSSTLIYRTTAPRPVRYSSVAAGVLERLRHEYEVPEAVLARFAADLRLFDRVFSGISWGRE